MVWLEGQKNCEKHNWKIGAQEVRGRDMQKDLHEEVNNTKIFVSYANACYRWLQQRKNLIIKWIWWFVLKTPLSFLPQPFYHCLMGFMSKLTVVARMEVMHGFSSMDFHLPRFAWLQWLLSVRSTNSRDRYWVTNMASFLRETAS